MGKKTRKSCSLTGSTLMLRAIWKSQLPCSWSEVLTCRIISYIFLVATFSFWWEEMTEINLVLTIAFCFNFINAIQSKLKKFLLWLEKGELFNQTESKKKTLFVPSFQNFQILRDVLHQFDWLGLKNSRKPSFLNYWKLSNHFVFQKTFFHLSRL